MTTSISNIFYKLKEKIVLHTIFKNNWKTPDDLLCYLESKGFYKIDQGWYSVVYSHPKSNYVIKINSGDFDYGYAYFIDMCINNSTNKNLIDIIKYKQYSILNPFYFVLLPKLKNISSSHDLLEPIDISNLRLMCDLLQTNNESVQYIEDSMFHCVSLKVKQLFSILSYIDTSIYKFDICSKNIMSDRNGNWILTDPIHKFKK